MANPWYPFYPGDYGRDTAHLSLGENGAYRRLLDHYYNSGRPLPTDPELLFRICGAFTENEREAVRSVLRQFFVEDGDVYRQGRVERELVKQSEYRAKLSEGARKTNERRWGLSPSDSPSESPSGRKPQPQPQPQPQPKPKSNPQKDQKRSGAEAPPLPDWIPIVPWNGFIEMRKKKRATGTAYAMSLIVEELEKLKAAGEDIGAVLDQSTRNSWTDVYPLKGNHSNGNRAQQRQNANLEARQQARAAIVGN